MSSFSALFCDKILLADILAAVNHLHLVPLDPQFYTWLWLKHNFLSISKTIILWYFLAKSQAFYMDFNRFLSRSFQVRSLRSSILVLFHPYLHQLVLLFSACNLHIVASQFFFFLNYPFSFHDIILPLITCQFSGLQNFFTFLFNLWPCSSSSNTVILHQCNCEMIIWLFSLILQWSPFMWSILFFFNFCHWHVHWSEFFACDHFKVQVIFNYVSHLSGTSLLFILLLLFHVQVTSLFCWPRQ